MARLRAGQNLAGAAEKMTRAIRARPAEPWAGRLALEWRPVPWDEIGVPPAVVVLTAEIGAARYFVAVQPHEVEAWCEPRELYGRYRVEVGTFADIAVAKAACERDAQRRLRREEEAAPVDIRIAQPRRR